MRIRMSILFILAVLLLPVPGVAGAVDHSLYARLLERHVQDGLVDYAGLKNDRAPLDEYLEVMGGINPDTLSENEQLAFYINLYNAATMRLIVGHYPIESIKDVGSFFSSPWKARIVVLNGEMVSLDHIEHEIVRPRFEEPRVHFALNCSARSCPPLMNVPYMAETLEDQLTEATINYLNDGKNNYLVGRILYVSKIFDWFSEDFPDDLPHWIKRYARGALGRALDETETEGLSLRVEFLKYDWGLNDQAR